VRLLGLPLVVQNSNLKISRARNLFEKDVKNNLLEDFEAGARDRERGPELHPAPRHGRQCLPVESVFLREFPKKDFL